MFAIPMEKTATTLRKVTTAPFLFLSAAAVAHVPCQCPHPRRRPPPTAHRPSPAALPWGIVLGGPRALGRIGVSIAFTSYHSFCVCYSFKSHFFIWEYWECLSCPWLCFRVWQYFVLIVCHCGVIGVIAVSCLCHFYVVFVRCCAIGVWWAIL